MGDFKMNKKMLTALDRTMQRYVSPYAYSIGRRREDSLCLVQDDGKWVVTIVERGKDEIRYSSSSLFNSCLSFIKNAVGPTIKDEVCDQFGQELLR